MPILDVYDFLYFFRFFTAAEQLLLALNRQVSERVNGRNWY